MSFFHHRKDISAAYDRNINLLYRLALSHLGNDFDAQDAVQETFVKYLRHLPEFSSEEHEKAWLIRVATNVCLDILRRKKIRAYTPIEEIHSLGVYDDGIENADSVMSKLDKVSPKNKTAVILHYLEGYSVEETAKMLGISVSAVKMRLMRGRDEIKKNIKEE